MNGEKDKIYEQLQAMYELMQQLGDTQEVENAIFEYEDCVSEEIMHSGAKNMLIFYEMNTYTAYKMPRFWRGILFIARISARTTVHCRNDGIA